MMRQFVYVTLIYILLMMGQFPNNIWDSKYQIIDDDANFSKIMTYCTSRSVMYCNDLKRKELKIAFTYFYYIFIYTLSKIK